MIPSVLTLWMAAALGQAPTAAGAAAPEAAWLKSVPAEAEVVIRVRGVKAGRDDLGKMIQAMSPTLAQQADPILDAGLAQFAQRFGKAAQNLPFLVVGRLPALPKGGNDANPNAGGPPIAILIGAKDYAAVQKQLAGPAGNAKPKPQRGGYDALTGPDGQPIYTAQGNGFVVISNNTDLISAVVKPEATLDRTLSADLRGRLFGGDLGLYVNLAAIQERYGDQIEQVRKGAMAKMDEAAGKAGNQNLEAAKAVYGRIFDAIKNGEALALNFDFAPEGLTLAGVATVRSGSDAAKALARAKAGAAEGLARLPDDAAFYTYSNVDPEAFERLQKLSLAFLPNADKMSPGLRKAMQMQREAAAREVTGAVSMGKGGMRAISVIAFADPQKAVEAMAAATNALKKDKSSLPAFIKDVEVEPAAETYKGFTFTRTHVTFDQEKLADLAPKGPKGAGAGAGAAAAILGESVTTWAGTDGKTFLSVTAPDWDQAKAQIDTVLGGRKTLGQVAGYKAIRDLLPKQVGSLFLISAQGLIKQGMSQFAAVAPDNPAAKVELDLPKAPALLGGAVTPSPKGYLFQFVVPSPVGKVVEQAVGPLLQGAGKVQE